MTIKKEVEKRIAEIAKRLFSLNSVPLFQIEAPKSHKYGDLATNLPFILAKTLKTPPDRIASDLSREIEGGVIESAEAVKGFVNITIKNERLWSLLVEIEEKREEFGRSNFGGGRSVLIEFVSANPTGPLHIGHGRGAAYGDALSNILQFSGFSVEKEYYVNNVGRQIEALGESVKARYLQILGEDAEIPEDGYYGEYISDIAQSMKERYGESIKNNNPNFFSDFAYKLLLSEIVETLSRFRTRFDTLCYEDRLYENKYVERTLSDLKTFSYTKDGALWLRTSEVSDEQDRVLVREDRRPTYYAADLAYHRDKFNRGYDILVNLWGTDHHGYIERIRSGIKLLGFDPERLKIILYQLVTLKRGDAVISMSTRKGEFIRLSDVLDEVGVDATRFFLLMRKADSHLEFDLELAKKESSENPVYYVQYLHARCASILREAEKRGVSIERPNFALLKTDEEHRLMAKLSLFPDTVEACANLYQPHHLTIYLIELSTIFHNYYHCHRVLTSDLELTKARLVLVKATKSVVKTGLSLLGISAPERM